MCKISTRTKFITTAFEVFLMMRPIGKEARRRWQRQHHHRIYYRQSISYNIMTYKSNGYRIHPSGIIILVLFVVAKRQHCDTKKINGIVLNFEIYLRLVLPVDIYLAMTIVVVIVIVVLRITHSPLVSNVGMVVSGVVLSSSSSSRQQTRVQCCRCRSKYEDDNRNLWRDCSTLSVSYFASLYPPRRGQCWITSHILP